MTLSERIMVEEFDQRYQNRCKLKLALRGYPGFDNLKAVTEFTTTDKVKYIRVIRYVEQFVKLQRAADAGLIPPFDPFDEDLEVPAYIDRIYLATVIGIL